MSIVDGCALRVCSGAKVPSWPLADWTDQQGREPAFRMVLGGGAAARGRVPGGGGIGADARVRRGRGALSSR